MLGLPWNCRGFLYFQERLGICFRNGWPRLPRSVRCSVTNVGEWRLGYWPYLGGGHGVFMCNLNTSWVATRAVGTNKLPGKIHFSN